MDRFVIKKRKLSESVSAAKQPLQNFILPPTSTSKSDSKLNAWNYGFV